MHSKKSAPVARGKKATPKGGGRTPAQSNKGPSAIQASASSPISASAMATYKLVQAQLAAQKKAAQEAEDVAIRNRNRQLLDAEDSGPSKDPRAAKRRKSAPTAPELSDDELVMAASLTSVNALSNEAEEEVPPEEEEDTRQSLGEDEDLPAELDGVNVDDVDVDMDNSPDEEILSNQIDVNEDVVAASRKSHLNSVAPKTPRSKGQHASSSHTSKVVEKDFTPRTLKLALASKAHVRTRTVYDDPFPRNNKIARINFAWKTIKETAMANDDTEVRQAYKRAMGNTALKGQLMKFTLYGRTGLVSSIISKAREKVRAFYCLSGDPELVKKDVEWLLKDSHFVYGGVDLKERTVDHLKPFGAQLIVDIIEAQWFPSTSRSKLDLETTNRIHERRDLPLNVVLLVVTAIEHALKEWSTNGRKASQITFSEDTARLSYERHLGHWKFFEAQMKAWPNWWRKTTLEQILANHSHLNLNVDENDFAGLDFAALDRLAGFEEEGEKGDEEDEGAGGEQMEQEEGVTRTPGESRASSRAPPGAPLTPVACSGLHDADA